MPHSEKERAKLLMNFNRSAIIDFDDIAQLKNILKIMGIIKNEIIFANENYDAERKFN